MGTIWSKEINKKISTDKNISKKSSDGGKENAVFSYAVCPRSSDPIYIVTYYVKWVTTFWTYSNGQECSDQDVYKIISRISRQLLLNTQYISVLEGVKFIPLTPK